MLPSPLGEADIAHRLIHMTDTRSDIVSVVERTHQIDAGGAVIAAHFLGRTAVFVLGEEAMVFAEPKGEPRRVDGASAARSSRPPPTARASSAAATTASDRDRRAGESRTLATDAEAALDRSCRARAGRCGRLVGRQDGVRSGEGAARIRSALDRRRPCLSAEGLSPGDRALQRRHAVVSRTRRRRRRKSSNGRARISAPP